MTQDDTIKIMKLSSGEEIICNLVGDEHPRTFSISSPLKMNAIPRVTRNGVEEALSLQRWIHFSEGDLYDIPKAQVLVITQASVGLTHFYKHCLKRMEIEEGDIEPVSPSNEELDKIRDEELEEMMNEYEPHSKVYH